MLVQPFYDVEAAHSDFAYGWPYCTHSVCLGHSRIKKIIQNGTFTFSILGTDQEVTI
jgi:hypothetical protein